MYPFFLFFILVISSCTEQAGWTEPIIVEEPIIPTEPVEPTYANLTDDELMDKVQKDALKYFWEYAETNSKLARERYHVQDPGNDAQIVTTGGSGFGLMSMLVGVERGFVPRAEAVSRFTTALNFLENADRFHGAWPHWMNGTNGNVIPFSTYDNGGDLVETSFLCQALICMREYFKNGTTEEQALAQKADDLWKGVEWDWYTKGENILYWHWSPNYAWQMDFKIRGYDESLITYILAKSSPTHPISNEVYTQGWARNGAIVSTASSYGVPKIVNHNGTNSVGPMFWSHYSFLGLDPRGLTDQYADYWNLTQNHAKIMLNYCVANPSNFKSYSDKFWGLTAGYTRKPDGSVGYTAHQPNNDRGVVTPTAALSNFPYTPIESMKFLRYLYFEKRSKFVGIAGPYDAVSPHFNDWTTKRYLAIDQGTIIPMIENHRSGFLWNLFMQAPEVRTGLQGLGFSSAQHGI